MSVFKTALREFLGLFVDDGALAALVLALVAAVTAAVKGLGLSARVGGWLLLIGCLVVLAGSLIRKTREK